METKRAFTAVMLSLLILLGYQYFFTPPPPVAPPVPQGLQENTPATVQQATVPVPVVVAANSMSTSPAGISQTAVQQMVGKDIAIETSLYNAIISENGGGIKSFKLKDYKETLADDAEPKELIYTEAVTDLPLAFAWGNGVPQNPLPYKADQDNIRTREMEQATLTMSTSSQPGLQIERTMTFADDSYRINLEVTVKNGTSQALQGAPYLRITNRPFEQASKGRYVFSGPALYVDDALQEVKVKNLKDDGPQTIRGSLSWAAYEDRYFICSIIPTDGTENNVTFSLADEDKVSSTVSGAQEIIPPGGQKTFTYDVYIGPKKLSILKQMDSNLDKAINFGWFDKLAKPTLYLMNFLYRYLHNYGVAIILITIFFKAILWPISYKGMKSMKNMQKVQPKMTALREKYKDDKERLNQEMVSLYKTYKVNPVGGCLPMVLQIPVFFALYKVLLQTIELRHAPFMLWINDLAAPDRLFIGVDIPYLGGIPVLTILMGASMFLQQKMTPTTADPSQAKVMMFLPVIFTFMFLNFASGLVLYWFINNLLSIGQQYFINRSVEA